MDRISLHGLRVVARHGVLPEEQERAQPFEIDVDLHVDCRTAGQSDALADTVDYGTLADSIVALVTNESHQLLERVAERIAERCCADARVQQVTVTVTKTRPPVAADLRATSVTVVRP